MVTARTPSAADKNPRWEAFLLSKEKPLSTFAVFAPMVVALLGVATGTWASLYSGELKAFVASAPLAPIAFFSHVCEQPPPVWQTILLFVAFAVSFVLQQYLKKAEDWYARRRSSNQLSQAVDKLEDVHKRTSDVLAQELLTLESLIGSLETMPPRGFLEMFAGQYNAVAHLPFLGGMETISLEELDKSTCIVLSAVAGLAAKFDHCDNADLYVANVMVYHDQSSIAKLSGHERSELARRLVYQDGALGSDLFGLRGILEEVLSLSTASKAEFAVRESITLPVPVRAKLTVDGNDRYLVLPGAPYAVTERRHALFSSTKEILEWCENKADFPKHVRQRIAEYFTEGGGTSVKSFVSIPLLIAHQSMCIGVLNIHCKESGKIGSDYDHFVKILEPFLYVLASLLALRKVRLSQPRKSMPDRDPAASIARSRTRAPGRVKPSRGASLRMMGRPSRSC